MNRRQLLSFKQSAETDTETLDQGPGGEPRTNTGLTPYAGAWTIAEAKHLLRRAMFGATKADVNHVVSVGMNSAVSELLTPTAVPAPPLYVQSYWNAYNDPALTGPDTTRVNTTTYDNSANPYRLRSMKAWWFGQMLGQNISMQEKMVVFWHNHFSTETNIVKDARYTYKHNTVLRQYALGNFKSLVKAITLDPNMLMYLNGYLNTKNAPDENYGRELQELFTIGKDDNGIPYYMESDVQMAAKVLTGYRVNGTTVASFFDSTKHDISNKTFSAFYNNTVITGQAGTAGANELDDLMNMIFATNQAALFLCRKIYRYFVYYNIDAQIETDVIVPLANIFRSNNYDIVPVLDALLKSEHFYDMANRGCLIKTPVDFAVAFCRDYNVAFPGSSALDDQYGQWYKLWTNIALMGQTIGDPPNVAGWPAYYQEPAYHELWINTNTLPNRNIFSDLMCGTIGYKAGTSTILLDVVGYTGTLDNANDPNLLIQEVIDRHLSEDISQTVKDYLKGFLLNGQTTDSYWTQAWVDYTSNPGNLTYYNIVATRLRAMFKYLMDLSEYQLS